MQWNWIRVMDFCVRHRKNAHRICIVCYWSRIYLVQHNLISMWMSLRQPNENDRIFVSTYSHRLKPLYSSRFNCCCLSAMLSLVWCTFNCSLWWHNIAFYQIVYDTLWLSQSTNDITINRLCLTRFNVVMVSTLLHCQMLPHLMDRQSWHLLFIFEIGHFNIPMDSNW